MSGSGPDILDSGGGRRWWDSDDDAPGAPRIGRAAQPPGPPAATGRRERRRRLPDDARRLALVALGAVVLGAVLGVAGDRALLQRERAAEEATLLAVALAGADPASSAGDRATARWDVSVQLRNDGPLPVSVLDARLDASGMTTDPLPEPVVLTARSTTEVPLTGSADCGALRGLDGDGPDLVVDLRTEDRARHTVELGPLGPAPGAPGSVVAGCPEARGRVVVAGVELAPRQLDARLTLSDMQTGDRRIRSVSLVGVDGVSVETLGLPLRLDPQSSGQVLLSVRVEDCAGLRRSDLARSSLRLEVDDDQPVTVPTPEALATGLVDLSSLACPT